MNDMALAYLLGIVLVFAVIREVLCWYWKVNILVKLGQNQLEALKAIQGTLSRIEAKLTPSTPTGVNVP